MHDQEMGTADQLAQTLVKSRIISLSELDQANQRMQGEADAAALAGELVSNGALTDYQAATLLRRDSTSLICGDYVILDKVGQGSMGQVFKAVHRHMERIVALKVLTRFAALSPETIERFRREAEVVATLDHPNIVRAFDARIDQPQSYLIMEYVDGVDLATLVEREGALPVRLACQYVLQAARGLAHAHARNIIHRDVKPSNLIVDSAGIVKVLDLGVARLQSPAVQDEPSGRRLTDEGQVLGTVAFMAPEQAEDSRFADARSDIYSLGCTFYYLLTRNLPFSGATISETLDAHRNASAPLLSESRPNVSAGLQRIFEKSVAKEPGKRYESMDEFIKELDWCIKNGHTKAPENARPPRRSDREPSPRWKGKPPRPSLETVSIRSGHGKSSNPTLPPPLAASKRKRPVIDITAWRVFLAAAGVIVTLLVILAGFLLSRDRSPTAGLSQSDAQSPSGESAPNRDQSANVTEPQKQHSENAASIPADSSSPQQEDTSDSQVVQPPTQAKPSPLAVISAEPSPMLNPPPNEPESSAVRPPEVEDEETVSGEDEEAVSGDDDSVSPPVNSRKFSLTFIIGTREEKLTDVDAAIKRLELFIEIRNRAAERRSTSLPFVAALTVDDRLFELPTAELTLELCQALQSASATDDAVFVASRVAGAPVDLEKVKVEVDDYVQRHFPRQLDQWVEEKGRMPEDRDVRRVVMKIISLGKADDEVPAYIDYRPTSQQLDTLLGDTLAQKSEQLTLEARNRPPPSGPRPPPPRPPQRRPPR